MGRALRADAADRSRAIIVVALTLACTGLAQLDRFLLASSG
jgi:hypothetical protein